MQRNAPYVFRLSDLANNYLETKQISNAIDFYAAAANKKISFEDAFTAAFFLSLYARQVEAIRHLQTGIELVQETNRIEILSGIAQFFTRQHQSMLAYLTYQEIHKHLSKQKQVVYSNSDYAPLHAKAALDCGKFEEAKKILPDSDRRKLLAASPQGEIPVTLSLLNQANSLLINFDNASRVAFAPALGEEHFRQIEAQLAKHAMPAEMCYRARYFRTLFASATKGNTQLTKLAENHAAPAKIRQLARIACAGTDATQKEMLAKEYDRNFNPVAHNLEDNCIQLITSFKLWKLTNNVDYYSKMYNQLIKAPMAANVLRPLAIPYYLRAATIEILLNSLSPIHYTASDFDDIVEIGNQYLALLDQRNGLNADLATNLAVQMLTTDSFVGQCTKFLNTDGFIQYIKKNIKNELERDCLALSEYSVTLIESELSKPNSRIHSIPAIKSALMNSIVKPVLILSTSQTEPTSGGANWGMGYDLAYQGRYTEAFSTMQLDHMISIESHDTAILNSIYQRAFYISLRAGKFQTAKDFLARMDKTPIKRFYFESAMSELRKAREQAYSQAPQGIHRLTFNPVVDDTSANKCLAKSKQDLIFDNNIDRLQAEALYYYETDNHALAYQAFIRVIEQIDLLGKLLTPAAMQVKVKALTHLGHLELKLKHYKQAVAQFELAFELAKESSRAEIRNDVLIVGYIKALVLAGESEKITLQLISLVKAEANQLLVEIYCKEDKADIKKLAKKQMNHRFVRNADAFCICAMALIYSNQPDAIHELCLISGFDPTNIVLTELSSHLREDYVAILLDARFKPEVMQIHDDYAVETIKSTFVNYICATKNIEAGLQALCKQTTLGWFFRDDFKRRQEILAGLEAALNPSMAPALSISTKAAINVVFAGIDTDYFDALVKGYPRLTTLISKLKQQWIGNKELSETSSLWNTQPPTRDADDEENAYELSTLRNP